MRGWVMNGAQPVDSAPARFVGKLVGLLRALVDEVVLMLACFAVGFAGAALLGLAGALMALPLASALLARNILPSVRAEGATRLARLADAVTDAMLFAVLGVVTATPGALLGLKLHALILGGGAE